MAIFDSKNYVLCFTVAFKGQCTEAEMLDKAIRGKLKELGYDI